MGSFLKLKKAISSRKKFLLIAHEQPDGDCLGGILALNEVLSNLNKDVRMVCKNVVPSFFSFLEDSYKIQNDFLLGDYDTIILVDNGDSKRTGFYNRIKKSDALIINIDHHPKNDLWRKVDINYANEEASSSCELIYEIIKGLGLKIDSTTATYLLTGIFTDTGGFQHSNTSKKILNIVSDLLSHGARLNLISENIVNSRNISTLKLWGLALQKLKINQKYSIVYSYLSRKDIENAQATDDDISGLINIYSALPESRVSLLLCETRDGKIRGSFRTANDNVDVSFLSRMLGGGGHRKAAGFTIDGRLEESKNGWKIV